jgi:uncharacterized protein (DUF362 family)
MSASNKVKAGEGELEKSNVILRGVSPGALGRTVRECMELCEWESVVPRGATVVIKPNLCTVVPEQMEKSNTDTRLTEAVCEVLLSKTKRIYIGEADHLRRKAQEAFEISGHAALAQKLDLQLVNFSEVARVKVACEPVGVIEMPRMLLEADAFITIPALKTHALTYFTGALKNQWGCVPQHNRILLHKFLDPLLASLQQLLRPRLALMDGIVAMEGRGPVNGNPRPLNVILASRDAVALDATAMRLVGLDPRRARHIVLAASRGLGQIDPNQIEVDGDWEKYQTQFKPGELDWAIKGMLFMSKYNWFVKYILEKDYLFYPVRSFFVLLRKLGVVGGG